MKHPVLQCPCTVYIWRAICRDLYRVDGCSRDLSQWFGTVAGSGEAEHAALQARVAACLQLCNPQGTWQFQICQPVHCKQFAVLYCRLRGAASTTKRPGLGTRHQRGQEPSAGLRAAGCWREPLMHFRSTAPRQPIRSRRHPRACRHRHWSVPRTHVCVHESPVCSGQQNVASLDSMCCGFVVLL